MKIYPMFVGDEKGLRDYTIPPLPVLQEDWLKHIESRRRERGLSRGVLAEKVGVSSEYIRLLERGERSPAEAVAYRIRQILF